MEHQTFGGEVTIPHHAPTDESKKRIWKTTIILSIITMIELGIGYLLYLTEFSHGLDLAFKGVVIILSLLKAFYIVSIFMHLGDEIRNLIMTIVAPLMIFIWFIIAFLYEGASWKNLRNEYNPKEPVKYEQTTTPSHEGGLK
ncbi:MAG: cytochrome C oxidase subunit IV family protein [Chitinophagaceae bacterium]|nr:cytochrome C oxidase subunit IV family protein [Chitinophagaceae bacterium]